MPQVKRTETLQRFKDEEITLLVCSDVAARGIDVKNVSHVFNYDVPMTADDYVHRIGRTGRAGQKGRAWMMSTDRDQKFLDAVEKLIKKKFDPVDLKVKNSNDGGTKNAKSGKKTASKPHQSKSTPKKKYENKGVSDDSSDDLDDATSFGDDIPAFLR